MRERRWRKWCWIILVTLLVAGCPGKKNPCRNPKYVQAMKEEAIAYYQQGDFISAQKSADAAASCKPKDAELYYWLWLILFQRGKYYESIAAFQRALEIDKNYAEAHMGLGAVYLALQRWDDAIREFEAALDNKYFPRPYEAYNNIGWAYMQKGDYALAEANLKKAVQLNDKYCPAYCNLGELCSKQNRQQEAIAYYQKAISLCNNYARPHFLLGVEYGRLGRYAQACAELAIAAQAPNAPEASQARDYMRLYNCPASAYPNP